MLQYKILSDQELTSLLRVGDKYAYTEIYNRHKNLLQNHLYKKLGDLELVKDVLQDLFVKLWDQKSELPITDNLPGYLFSAARNRVFNHLSRQQVASKYISSLHTFINEDNYITDLAIREKEFAKIIRQEIEALPAKMREVFLLSRDGHFSHEEIAKQLGISPQTVSKQISNALKTLRLRLGVLFYFL
ncbi:RNA polymerase sigma factor [Pedobacter gandavensis]|uniref:RNA polymerase sigma-70 factor n=1 Tax=Pedobacter gandavensis TaxID=2679963 RepID=A0ABR6EVI2_9SPHI|nr:RNA polymerase sigma-70 factor [Pedobacter gandavensis]MBB2149259.1 RNA polymerase sigma-70 factor [Pedobacter gandavensis]